METHIADITRVIQLAVAPVFLLTAIGTLITALNNRLGRAVDRRRVVQERLQHASQEDAAEARVELRRLEQRSRLIYFAILAAVVAALFICLVVAGAFVGALVAVELSKMIAVLFILAMCALIVSLALFLREIFLAVSFGGLRLRG
ncbi:MAG: DUF2721 domain-containing protein [Betaproteobacteria bacterium]|jgi:uncharacterized membrane protein YjjP (DUF1212 family)|nr:MAG: DUF2721 domain-containing protein [Betaproteobacteria bacterium]